MSASYKIDDSKLFDNIDELLANLDIKFLMEVKLELMKEGKDTSIIDKAINERNRRDKIITKRKKINQKRLNKLTRQALLMGLINGLSNNNKSSDLMSWEEDAIKNNGYEKYNFEEEELEEDDYYFDDDK